MTCSPGDAVPVPPGERLLRPRLLPWRLASSAPTEASAMSPAAGVGLSHDVPHWSRRTASGALAYPGFKTRYGNER